jgi:DNA-binding response OmpR family regulator
MADQNRKVLLVDDDPSFVHLYTTAFKSQGIDFSVAVTGFQALDKLRLEKPTLVLLDIMLPDINGFEILQRMKREPELSKIPVVMLTNLSEQSGKNKAASLGAVDYVVKAFTSPIQMCKKIQRYFGSLPTPPQNPPQNPPPTPPPGTQQNQ